MADDLVARVRKWFAPHPRDGAQLHEVDVLQQATATDALRAYHAGVGHFKRGDLEEAQRCLHESLKHKHDLAAAHFYLGLILHKRRMLDDATDELLLATTFDSKLAEAWLYLGVIAIDRKEYQAACVFFESAVAARDNYAAAYNGLGKVHEELKQFEQASTYYRRAIQANPQYGLAYANLAYATMRERLDPVEAIAYIEKAIELDPSQPESHATRAMILQYNAHCEEAIAAANVALELDPDSARARMVRGLARLMLGDFQNGWPDYEARRQVIPLMRIRTHPFAEWDGSDLHDKTILVYYEQGIGDEIMFASCLPDLMRTGAACYVECSRKVEPLFRRSFPAARVVVADQLVSDMSYLETLPHIDYQVAAGSVPRYFRRSWSDFPLHVRYLTADDRRLAYWQHRLSQLGPNKKVGLSWSGGMHSSNRARRSLQLHELLPLLRMPGIEFVSLQYGDWHDQIASFSQTHRLNVVHWQEAIDDYDDTAALTSALDLVISVQTALIHLAGALGKTVWIMVPSTPEWRYMADGTQMPWYPSARIFRQEAGSGWTEVVENVRCALEDWLHQSADA